MSEIINNRAHRQKVLKGLIKDLHAGRSFDEVKAEFDENFGGVAASEIAEMEQNLIMEGMPAEEIQRLCDVHSAVFRGSIQEIHHPEEVPGHPIYTFKLENQEIKKLSQEISEELARHQVKDDQEQIYKLLEKINLLWDIDKHYSRKENLLFPYLEKHGISGPTKVMWGVDDEIRRSIKDLKKMLSDNNAESQETVQNGNEVITRIEEMIFKEENILFPMALDNLTEDEWLNILDESADIGYCLIDPEERWRPLRSVVADDDAQTNLQDGHLKFPSGSLTSREISAIFNNLPVDVTFIDKDDVVRYFSQPKERIFVRTKAVIGRNVQNCHPPNSVHIVEKMLEDFKSGKKDSEDFWIRMGNQYILIRYFAIRDTDGSYIGTIEVTQNIQPLQELQGEKRLMSD